jgi:hypothetical protein
MPARDMTIDALVWCAATEFLPTNIASILAWLCGYRLHGRIVCAWPLK